MCEFDGLCAAVVFVFDGGDGGLFFFFECAVGFGSFFGLGELCVVGLCDALHFGVALCVEVGGVLLCEACDELVGLVGCCDDVLVFLCADFGAAFFGFLVGDDALLFESFDFLEGLSSGVEFVVDVADGVGVGVLWQLSFGDGCELAHLFLALAFGLALQDDGLLVGDDALLLGAVDVVEFFLEVFECGLFSGLDVELLECLCVGCGGYDAFGEVGVECCDVLCECLGCGG